MEKRGSQLPTAPPSDNPPRAHLRLTLWDSLGGETDTCVFLWGAGRGESTGELDALHLGNKS